MSLAIGTNFILKDEPCFALYEVNVQSPGNRGFHRYQKIFVIREDREAEYCKDMGEVERYKGIDQFHIPGGLRSPDGKIHVYHTVGELLDMADQLRDQRSVFDKKELIGANRIKES